MHMNNIRIKITETHTHDWSAIKKIYYSHTNYIQYPFTQYYHFLQNLVEKISNK